MTEQTLNLDSLMDDALDAQIDTSRISPPDGEYTATIAKIDKARLVEAKKGPNAGKVYVIVDFHYRLHEWREEGYDELPPVKSGIMVDTDANGKLDLSRGKNRTLGLIMEAAGLNDGKSRPADLFGCTVSVKVKTTTDDKGNTNTNVYNWASAS